MNDRTQTTLVRQVFDQVFQLLLSGELPLGGVVNEVALAERFNVSRGPVREAMSLLQGRGLIVKEPYIKARVVELTVANMIEIFQLREAVEGMSIRLATQNMSDEAIASLIAAHQDARENGTSPQIDMHVAIAEGSGNERVRALLCDELYYLLRLYRARSGENPGRRGGASTEHWQILRALQLRDGDLAESLMRSHIASATRSLQDLLQREDLHEPPKDKGK